MPQIHGLVNSGTVPIYGMGLRLLLAKYDTPYIQNYPAYVSSVNWPVLVAPAAVFKHSEVIKSIFMSLGLVRYRTYSCVGVAAVAAMVGCGENSAPAQTKANSASLTADQVPSASDDKPGTIKFNSYTDSYNKLIGKFGLVETSKNYLEVNIQHRKPAEIISITDGWVKEALQSIKKSRELRAAGFTEIDQAADRLIAPLQRVVSQLDALNIYYASKAYKKDGLARGNAADPLLRADFELSIAELKRLGEI